MIQQFKELAKKNPNDMELGAVVRSAIHNYEESKRFCNFCHTKTYTKDEDCVDCGYSKPHKDNDDLHRRQ